MSRLPSSDIMSAACSDPTTKRKKTVHWSLAGLRKCERTGEQQHQAISNMLASSVGFINPRTAWFLVCITIEVVSLMYGFAGLQM